MNARQHVSDDHSDGLDNPGPPWARRPPDQERRWSYGTHLLAYDAGFTAPDPDAARLAPDEYHALDDLIVLFGGDAEARARVGRRRDALVKHLVACEECKVALASLLDAGSRTTRLSGDQRA